MSAQFTNRSGGWGGTKGLHEHEPRPGSGGGSIGGGLKGGRTLDQYRPGFPTYTFWGNARGEAIRRVVQEVFVRRSIFGGGVNAHQKAFKELGGACKRHSFQMYARTTCQGKRKDRRSHQERKKNHIDKPHKESSNPLS